MIASLYDVSGFPGLFSHNGPRQIQKSPDDGDNQKKQKVFVFRGTDLVQYMRRETLEMRHLLFAYKIKI